MSQRERGDTLPDVTLTCQNASCGNAFAFTGGEQNFFNQRGFSPPALCPSCRAEKKAQQDVEVSCQVCGFTRSVRKEYIISFRRKQGPWVPPTLCRMCEEDPERAARIMQKNAATQQANAFFAGNQSNPRQHVFSDQRGRYGQRILKKAKRILDRLLIYSSPKGWFEQAVLTNEKEVKETFIQEQKQQGLTPLQGKLFSDYASLQAPLRKEERYQGTYTGMLTRKQHIWGDEAFEKQHNLIIEDHRADFERLGFTTFEAAINECNRILASADPEKVLVGQPAIEQP